MIINLIDLPENQTAIIKEIKGGYCLLKKMECIGIRVGKSIAKVNGKRGPQIIRIDNLQIAIGFGMAKHIVVEIKDEENFISRQS